jgi:flagellin
MRVLTNVISLTAMESIKNNGNASRSSLEKLASGLAINKASDDASGLVIADKIRTQASSLKQGMANINSAVAMMQIADKAMSEQSNILDIAKQKLLQAATSTTSADGRESVRKDISKLLDGLDNIANSTNYNGEYLLQKDKDNTTESDSLRFQIGENAALDIVTTSIRANSMGLGGGTKVYADNDNIQADEKVQLKLTEKVTLTNVNLDATGNETVAANLDFNLSGRVEKLSVQNSDINLDIADESDEMKNILNILANDNPAVSISGDIITMTAGSELKLNDLTLANTRVYSSAANTEFTIGDNTTSYEPLFSIQNNHSDQTPNLGQINMSIQGTATGGNLLNDLKNVAEDGLSSTLANDFIGTIDEALNQLNLYRSSYGSTQNQLESSMRSMQTTTTNLKHAESVIRDSDYGYESMHFNQLNIVSQSGNYAFSQANALPDDVLKLLQQ